MAVMEIIKISEDCYDNECERARERERAHAVESSRF